MSSTTTTTKSLTEEIELEQKKRNEFCELMTYVARWVTESAHHTFTKPYSTTTGLYANVDIDHRGNYLMPYAIDTEEDGTLWLTWARAGRLGYKLTDIQRDDS